ncbi:cytochrome b561 and DOMON domain-containing protein At5g35735-like [Andrographis paniculata]|uniref:cytochrome b561 and DOMON domain-containing protein At5g35735-like n=1 Tax=Andrographis paniculata TaxID=175694 RepID=UPI0021E8E492|nr:cytochrome b561 and DOMON domain-containing protein At5g35735-like [Andrographis paniculata]
MEGLYKVVLSAAFFIVCLSGSTRAQSCSGYAFSNNNVYAACSDLPVLNSFLHWTYHPANHTVDLAYRHTGMSTSNWIVWSLNPTGGAMSGAQCLVALHNSSGNVHAYTSPVSGYATQLEEGNLSFAVPSIAAEFRSGEMIIFATVALPSGRTSFTQVWQFGNVNGNVPQRHETTGDNMRSFGTIDFSTGQTADTGAAGDASRNRKRNRHGVLNVVSWGILMPIGAMAARYLKVFEVANPLWFYLHVSCQASAYIVGVAGWGTGLKLGSDSPGVEQTKHRNIGIVLFAFGTLQVFALLLRPKPDHKYRVYWNAYHHAIGYSVIALSIVNIFEGFDILDPEKKWKRAYIGVLIALGAVALVLEAFTWFVVLRRKSDRPSDKRSRAAAVTGVNGSSSHGA